MRFFPAELSQSAGISNTQPRAPQRNLTVQALSNVEGFS